MTTQPHHPTAPHGVTYSRTNRTRMDAEHDLARQYRRCQAIGERLGELTGHFYDIGVESRHDPARTNAIAALGGPPSRDGGSAELTAELGPTASIDVTLVAEYARLPHQPSRRWPLLKAAGRRGCAILVAGELSARDHDADRAEAGATARIDPRVVTRVLRAIGDGR
jgi:hypothetical protein